MTKSKSKRKLFGDHAITAYQCGVHAGDQVKLRRDLVVRDRKGEPTGVIHRAGDIWKVSSCPSKLPIHVWLKQPDGRRHTWSDDADFLHWFEKVAPDQSLLPKPQAPAVWSELFKTHATDEMEIKLEAATVGA